MEQQSEFLPKPTNMKYSCTVIINAPIDKVVQLWEDETHFKDWQDDFKSIELIEGNIHAKGSKSKILFDGKHKIELIETILINNLPTEKKALYEHVHMSNTQKTSFIALGDNETQYISEVEYLKFNGLIIKLMAKLFPSKFKAQSQKWMEQFKVFVEQKK